MENDHTKISMYHKQPAIRSVPYVALVALLVLVAAVVVPELPNSLYEDDFLLKSRHVLFGDLSHRAVFSLPTTILITGANSGLGFETVKQLAQRKCDVARESERNKASAARLTIVMACRNMDKCQTALNQVESTSGCGSLELLPAPVDLSESDSVRKFAANLQVALPRPAGHSVAPIHVMIHNAGIAAPYKYLEYSNNEYNVETHYNTHYFGHVTMTHHLWENVLAVHHQEPARKASVVTVSEGGTVFDMDPFAGWYNDPNETAPWGLDRVYWMARNMQQMTRSKQAQLYFAAELQARYPEAISTSASHPGYTLTPIYDKLDGFPTLIKLILGNFPIGSMSPSQGALTTLLATLDSDAMYVGPKYFFFGPPVVTSRSDNLAKGSVHHREFSMERSEALWKRTMQVLNVSEFGTKEADF